uniref:Uncharacterized protein n=1 Tax=Ditylenchus dipsaci TaxID=166011 RepID=A0A915DT34_9BILA
MNFELLTSEKAGLCYTTERCASLDNQPHLSLVEINIMTRKLYFYDSLHGDAGNHLNLLKSFLHEFATEREYYEENPSKWVDFCPKPGQLFTLSTKVKYYLENAKLRNTVMFSFLQSMELHERA